MSSKSWQVQRPFYILVIGDRNLLTQLTKECPENKIEGSGVKNTFSIVREDTIPIKSAIQYGSGNFRLDPNDSEHSIVKAKKDTKGVNVKKLRFNIQVDFSRLLMDDSYLLDERNYKLSDKDYLLEIQKNTSANGYSHLLKLSTAIVKPSTLSIRLKNQIPTWVSLINDEIGLDINSAPEKTFGLKYIVSGIYKAFTNNQDYCAEIVIKINQK